MTRGFAQGEGTVPEARSGKTVSGSKTSMSMLGMRASWCCKREEEAQ